MADTNERCSGNCIAVDTLAAVLAVACHDATSSDAPLSSFGVQAYADGLRLLSKYGRVILKRDDRTGPVATAAWCRG